MIRQCSTLSVVDDLAPVIWERDGGQMWGARGGGGDLSRHKYCLLASPSVYDVLKLCVEFPTTTTCARLVDKDDLVLWE